VHAPAHKEDGVKQQRRSARFDDCVGFEIHGHNNLKATAPKRKTLSATIRAAMINLDRQIGTLW
jgi:calcineurin-like phosphoesterase family protein